VTETTDTQRLLERDAELTELERLVGEACDGRGRLVLIEGPPGIGKTRLLEAVRTGARARGMTVLSARASELDREFPFGIARQLFEPLVAGGDEALLAGAAAPAKALVAGAGPSDPGASAGEGNSALAHFHALYWLTANLAEETPAALVLDDVHWADAGSLQFLQFLLPRVDELPVLVALAARPAEPGLDTRPIDALAVDPLAHVIRPAPLTGAGVAALVATSLGDDAEPAFRDACHQATGGNPFLVRELVRELANDGVVPSAERVALVRELAPPTVARAVLLRLARLGDDAAALARAVAVLGDAVPLQRAAALADLSQEPAGELASVLARSDILTSERPLAFAHPILRSAIYRDIDPGERSRLHRRAAALLAKGGAAADAVAVHLLVTEPGADPEVVATLRAAAAQALARGAAASAVAFLRRAADEPPPSAERGPVILELASAELRAGEPAAATGHFEEGARLTQDPRLRAASARPHAVALQAVGRHDEAFAVRERAVAAIADADPGIAVSLEFSLIGTARWDLSRLDWARERAERYRGRSSAQGPAEWRVLAMLAHLDAFAQDCRVPAEGLADAAERALAQVATADLVRGSASTWFFGAIEVLIIADRVELARRTLDEAVDAVRRAGSMPGFAFTSGWRCLLLARCGELAEAEADARDCVELSLSQGWVSVAPMILGFALEALLDRGHPDDAAELLARSGMNDRPADHDLTFDPVIHARARLRAERGDLEGARSDLDSLRRRGARWNTYPTLVPPVLVAPELIAGDAVRARGDAERMLAEARAWGTPRAIGMALRAMGLVEGGERGIALLREAVQVLEGSPARLEQGRALADLGAALRSANERAAAREPLRRALDLADACGARPLAERARQELRSAGGRPRRPRTSGARSLTASERRIATMAAAGLSNPEIAQALFVTKKTVESHLGNAYRKLDIRSRSELAAALEGGSAPG
jgi:DNA-binding CsgD family transcriptional regulator